MAMGEVQVERRQRLLDICKRIVAYPRSASGSRAALKSATMKYVATQYDVPEQGLERLYHNSPLLRRAVEIVDGVRKRRDNQNFRSTATGALYPRASRSFLDVLDEIDEDGDEDDANRDDADDDVAKAGDRHGHHSLSAALVQHLHDALDRRREAHGFHKSAKEQPMTSHTELVRDVVKQYGILALAKSMVQDQKSYGLDEHTFTQLATEHAQGLYPSDRPDVAFSKLYQSEESIRRACNFAKSMPFVADLTPLVVGTPAAMHDAVDDTESSKAYAQLKELGARKWPTASAAQQFANAFTDPVNKELAARAHRRPSPTTSYPFPR
jgi:hypothetical protein